MTAKARIRRVDAKSLDAPVPLLIVGAGACGVTAALAAAEHGLSACVLERDALARGSTALSSGLIPAAGTRAQARQGIDDSAVAFAHDIQTKALGRADAVLVERFTAQIPKVLDWFEVRHGLHFEVLEGFLYPGHSHPRMHAVDERTGQGLIDRLWRAAERESVQLVCDFRVDELLVSDRPDPGQETRILGVAGVRPDGSKEVIACEQLILACNGFGANRGLVSRWLPDMREALYFGHAGNQGEAVEWADALGLELADMGAYQGHGSVAHPHGVLITWAVIMDGGVQINQAGRRFWDESAGYSEAALAVLSQPDASAWNVFDERVHRMALQFPDYQRAVEMGALRFGNDPAELAVHMGFGADSSSARHLQAELVAQNEACGSAGIDRFGRRFTTRQALQPPYYAVRVTGALFHTQGGIAVDACMRARRVDGSVVANLFAAGGAARGVSGQQVSGYLSGNGLLSALAGGFIAAEEAARAQTPFR